MKIQPLKTFAPKNSICYFLEIVLCYFGQILWYYLNMTTIININKYFVQNITIIFHIAKWEYNTENGQIFHGEFFCASASMFQTFITCLLFLSVVVLCFHSARSCTSAWGLSFYLTLEFFVEFLSVFNSYYFIVLLFPSDYMTASAAEMEMYCIS